MNISAFEKYINKKSEEEVRAFQVERIVGEFVYGNEDVGCFACTDDFIKDNFVTIGGYIVLDGDQRVSFISKDVFKRDYMLLKYCENEGLKQPEPVPFVSTGNYHLDYEQIEGEDLESQLDTLFMKS